MKLGSRNSSAQFARLLAAGYDEAEALKELLARMPARLSLIDWNPVEGIDLRPPTEDERSRFHDQLAKLGVPVVRRYSGGKDIDAACGQLATTSGRRGRGRGADPAETPDRKSVV